MISIVITAFNEPLTIGKCIESIIQQNIIEDYELYISAPDKETQNIAKAYQKQNKTKNIQLFQDPGKGKSYALNLLLPKLKGEIIILTDGDVYLSLNSINELTNEFKSNKQIGCVTGRPTPQEDKTTKFGFWANFLFDSAHKLRKKLKQQNQFLECSGYLWAFRNNIIKSFPLDVAEDTVVPFFFNQKGYKISYAENARVFVKNTDNIKDWIEQKTRTVKAHEKIKRYTKPKTSKNPIQSNQNTNTKNPPQTKTFLNEIKGITNALTYPKTIKQLFWMFQLIILRLYIWIKAYTSFLLGTEYQDAWKRVDSTK